MLAEKYRPKSLDEIVGQEHIIPHLKEIVKRRTKVHFLFVGPAGVGKTSTAYALANELNIPIVELNASDERGINVIREKVKKSALTLGEKIILLDEADSMTEDAQHALRRIMEKSNHIFILTANDEWKIIEPIKSRCVIFRFRNLKNEEVLRILLRILMAEKINFKVTPEVKEALLTLVEYVHGDVRHALNMLESLITANKEIVVENIKSLIPPDFATQVLQLVVEGRWEEGLKKLEDLYIQNKLDSKLTIEHLYKAISKLNVNSVVKLRMYEKLGEIERGIKLGCNPLIQFSEFLASVYLTSVIAK
jgi:replication factor C small subunit